jgi:hypothetical protein
MFVRELWVWCLFCKWADLRMCLYMCFSVCSMCLYEFLFVLMCLEVSICVSQSVPLCVFLCFTVCISTSVCVSLCMWWFCFGNIRDLRVPWKIWCNLENLEFVKTFQILFFNVFSVFPEIPKICWNFREMMGLKLGWNSVETRVSTPPMCDTVDKSEVETRLKLRWNSGGLVGPCSGQLFWGKSRKWGRFLNNKKIYDLLGELLKFRT